MKARVVVLGAAALGVWLAQPGLAYWVNGQRWASGSGIVMHLQQGASAGTLIDGSPDWNTVTEGALASWNASLNGVSFRVLRDSTAGAALRNGVNNVIWGDDVYGDPFGDAIAVTTYLYRNDTMTEADVVFDRGRNWNSYRGNLRSASGGGTLIDLRRVALHEFGHVLGLGHPDQHGQSVTAVMNSRVSNVDTLQTDDTNGARAIYGSAPAPAANDTLSSGARLSPAQSRASANGRYRLLYQNDGNLVLYDDVDRRPLWSSNTGGTSAGQALLQGDGNFVVYDGQGVGRWATGTVGYANARLLVQNDGNLVLYRADGQPIWDRFR